MDSLLGVSHELLQLILAELEAEDLARLRQCCRSLRHFIGHNTLLWKSVYLRNYVSRSSAIPALAFSHRCVLGHTSTAIWSSRAVLGRRIEEARQSAQGA